MSKYYYKQKSINIKRLLRFGSIGLSFFGLFIIGYILLPLVSWQVYFAPVFADQNITAPIPHATVVNSSVIQSLFSTGSQTLRGIDYTNAKNWFPDATNSSSQQAVRIASYTLTIPKINIKNAVVSTIDYDLTTHLIHFGGTTIPPENGNAVIFGHSTLPQLFDPTDYKTIFANAYKLQVGDEILVGMTGVTYAYKIYSITVVDADDTSPLAQNHDNAYLTLITCTPPGTVWKRLIVKARLKAL